MKEEAPKLEPQKETGSNLKEKIIQSVLADDVDLLMQAVEDMNAYLTSHSKLGVPDQIIRQEDELKKFLMSFKRSGGKYGRAYIYLGDGGVSRLIISAQEGKIILSVSTVSSNAVKEKFEKLQ